MNYDKLKQLKFFENQNLEYAFDSLTKVINRELVLAYLNYLLDKKEPFTLCLCDIDNFKHINDNYGHMKGDEVLEGFAKEIENVVGNNGVVGRYGGDEFMIILDGITEYNDVWGICHSVNKRANALKFGINELNFSLTTGVSRFPIDGKDFKDILSTADKALYRGKMKGRNCFIIYLESKHSQILLKEDKEASFDSVKMHSKVFEILTNPNKKLEDNIRAILQYFSTIFMDDHFCIQNENGDIFESVVHPLSKHNNFSSLNPKFVEKEMNKEGVYFITKPSTLRNIGSLDYYQALIEQNIVGHFICRIDCHGKTFGYLRAETCDTAKKWQNNELDLLVTASKLIGVLINDTKI